jgi:uncharacterized protein YggU (UPF0235/DUF167 family)
MYIKVRVTPGAKVEKITKKADDHFVLTVREEAERNMANRRVVTMIADVFKVPTGKVRIINGHHSRSKILSVDIIN